MGRKILSCSGRVYSRYGTSKYNVKWQGDYEVQELVNYCDGGDGNYGGRLEGFKENGDDTKEATVCVYYD